MKKRICMVLVMAMCLAFAGCDTGAQSGAGGKDQLQADPTVPTSSEDNNEETAPATTEEPAASGAEATKPASDESEPPESGNEESTVSKEGSEETDPTAETEEVPTEPAEEDHVHQYSKKTTEPTCEKEGYTTYTCQCGDTYTDDIVPALGHDFLVEVVEPTATSKGFTAHTCMRKECGYHYKDNYTDPDPNATEPEPTEPPPSSPKADPAEVARYLIQYINQYRAEQNVAPLTYLPGMSKVAKYRSKQLVYNFAHDPWDIREAHAYYKYGEWIEMSDPAQSYYTAHAPEAIGKATGAQYMGAEELARNMAEAYRNSAGHWRYLGSGENLYVGVGVTFANGEWYDCVMVGPVNYG